MSTPPSVSFLGSFPSYEKLPKPSSLPEIALVGRSNVGKSSLINHALKRKVAKTSSTPGKTQMINLFLIAKTYLLADLPGYGYAKVPHSMRKKWGEELEKYFHNRISLSLTVLLLDSRRDLSEEDEQFLLWANDRDIALLIVLTKCDKLSKSEKSKRIQALSATLEELLQAPPPLIEFSVKDNRAGSILLKKIDQLLFSEKRTRS